MSEPPWRRETAEQIGEIDFEPQVRSDFLWPICGVHVPSKQLICEMLALSILEKIKATLPILALFIEFLSEMSGD